MTKITKLFAITLVAISITACSKNKPAYVAPLIQFEPTVAVNTIWTTSVGGGAHQEYLKLTPTLFAGNVYTSSESGQLSIINQQTGKRIWTASLKEPLSSGVGTDGDRVFVGTRKGEVLSVSTQDGSILWRVAVSNEVLAKPNVVDGMVMVKTINDHIYALDARSGKTIWSYTQKAPEMILRGGAAPKVSGNIAVAGFSDGSITAFYRHNGGMIWSDMVARPLGISDVEQMVDIDNSMLISGGVVYVATYQGAIAALDLQTGEMYWEKKMSSYAGLAVDERNVYVSEANGHLWALNRRTSDMLWRQENLTGRGVTGPVVIGNMLVVGDKEGFVHFMTTSNGQFVNRMRPDATGIIANPVTDGHAVYVLTNSGRLVKYGR